MLRYESDDNVKCTCISIPTDTAGHMIWMPLNSGRSSGLISSKTIKAHVWCSHKLMRSPPRTKLCAQDVLMDLGLKDVHVLVTGASGGIGLETVRVYAEHGAKVSAHYNTNISPLHDMIKGFGPANMRAVQADLTNEQDVSQMSSQHEGEPDFGPIHIVVINHGILPAAVSVAAMPLDQWYHTITTNLTSPFLVAREYLKRLSSAPEDDKAKANIVFVGSTAGKFGAAGFSDYAATKSAMMYGLTLSLKNEIVRIAPKGRVNCIAPGRVQTPMSEEALRDPAFVQRTFSTTSLKKLTDARDVANQIVCISSPTLSGHVSGQMLMMDGGMEGRLLNVPSDSD